MNTKIGTTLLIATCWLGASSLRAFQAQSQAQPQTCADDETVVTSVKQDLGDTVNTVKKETLDNFQKEFHQQASMSKLSICLGMVSDLLSCLDKAAHDPAVTKTQLNEIKTKQSSYAKLKDTINQDLQSLKAAKQPATAKAEIEKFDLRTRWPFLEQTTVGPARTRHGGSAIRSPFKPARRSRGSAPAGTNGRCCVLCRKRLADSGVRPIGGEYCLVACERCGYT